MYRVVRLTIFFTTQFTSRMAKKLYFNRVNLQIIVVLYMSIKYIGMRV